MKGNQQRYKRNEIFDFDNKLNPSNNMNDINIEGKIRTSL